MTKVRLHPPLFSSLLRPFAQVDPANYSADYVEFIFQDQYLGRSDMWRLGEHLVGQCVYTDQDVAFVGGIAAKIHTIYVGGKKVRKLRCKDNMLIAL